MLNELTDTFVKNYGTSLSVDMTGGVYPYKDAQGVVHIPVKGLSVEYHLVEGEWQEVSPF